MGLTSEQQAVIRARGPEVLVVAGAGTGKTHVLVERYLDLLADHEVAQLVAVTFTEAAATEMRERVRREVSSRPGLERHRAALDEAPIGTIHALCLRILLEHAAEAGIDPATRLLSEDEAEYELLLACVDALEDASVGNDGARAILELSTELGPESVLELVTAMVRARDDVRAAFAAMGDQPEAMERYTRSACAAAVAPLRAPILALAESLRSAACSDPADRLNGPWADTCDALATLPDGPEEFAAAVVAMGSRLRALGNVGAGRNWSPDPKTVRGWLMELRDLADETERLRWGERDLDGIVVVCALRDVFESCCRSYGERKAGLRALDFLDLELGARDLLRNRSDVASDYQRRFRQLLVDEFQDTNPIQVEILGLLAGGEDGVPPVDRFYVGDAKQAVYRFRGGDVRGFNRARTRLGDTTGCVLPLSQSFRTHRGLVGVVNSVFERVFATHEADFETSMEGLAGRDGDPPDGPHLVVMTVSDPANGSRADETDRTRFEGFVVATEIRALLDSGRPVWDREAGWRPVRYSDIAILLRRFTKVREFEEALAAAGVPYQSQQGAGFFQRPEVVDLTNLLGWLAEPDDGIALVGALRSPLFLLDDATLLSLRAGHRPFILALREPPGGLDADIGRRCKRIAAVLDELTALAAGESIDVVLARAMTLTGCEASWASLPGGDQAVANMRKLLHMAQSLRSRSIDEFVTYLVRRRDELVTREAQAVLDQSDAVRILTVHGAKGLEFPVVFVGETDVPGRSSADRVLWNRERGLSVTLARDDGEDGSRPRPGFYQVLYEQERREEVAEHRRLFYVACTRAGDYLYLTGDAPGGGGPKDDWQDWALPVLQQAAGRDVEVRPPLPVNLEEIKRAAPRLPLVPPAETEVDYVSPLLARPLVIPVRTSTPVTALLEERVLPFVGHGDGLAAFRGVVAHRALQLTYSGTACPPLTELVEKLRDRPLARRDVERIAAEVAGYLERFAATPLGLALDRGELDARFELPFAWDWDGVPVHGAIDLVYRGREGGWYVVDFKTDTLDGRSPADVAAPYLAQVGLYGLALQQAVGVRPSLALCFLRTGELHAVSWADAAPALSAARARVDRGVELASGTDDSGV